MTTIASMEDLTYLIRRRMAPRPPLYQFVRRLSLTKLVLILLGTLLICGGLAAYNIYFFTAYAEHDNTCNWYTVASGDTLSSIAWHYHTTISTLAKANAIHSTNQIFVNQHLCLPRRLHLQARASTSGIAADGTISWYNYRALQWSDRSQVRHLLYQVAAAHHLPPRLLLAIAWQESGWTQHVIAWDGGIGVMQLMPYTAMGINAGTGLHRDPYDLRDNLNLGATYLSWLWHSFHGNLPDVISAYNEGGWSVHHRGIFNQNYVNNVMALMNNLS